jgi:hypothetical protein
VVGRLTLRLDDRRWLAGSIVTPGRPSREDRRVGGNEQKQRREHALALGVLGIEDHVAGVER